jgi:PIN like domain
VLFQRQLKRKTFFLERSLGNGKVIVEELRKAGIKVEPHAKWFRHDTPDPIWLPIIGEKKWIVLMRDQEIGRRLLELDALIDGGVKAFVLVSGQLKDFDNAQIFIKAMPRILSMVDENSFPFIAKIQKDSTVDIWKTKPMIHKGIQKRRRK